MNIQFMIKVNNFEKAAGVEKALRSLGLNYQTRVDDKPSLGVGKRTRQVIGKAEVAAVAQCFANHPKWTVDEVARSTGIGKSTVGRVRLGTHALQRNDGGKNDSSIQEK